LVLKTKGSNKMSHLYLVSDNPHAISNSEIYNFRNFKIVETNNNTQKSLIENSFQYYHFEKGKLASLINLASYLLLIVGTMLFATAFFLPGDFDAVNWIIVTAGTLLFSIGSAVQCIGTMNDR
jgi:hypothetical protein